MPSGKKRKRHKVATHKRKKEAVLIAIRKSNLRKITFSILKSSLKRNNTVFTPPSGNVYGIL